MYPGGYTAEITSLSPKATEKDVHDFFAYCGSIEHVEIIRCGEYACTAYVTFKDAYSLETAVLLSGATIVDQSVCISRWGSYVEDSYPWDGSSWKTQEDASSTPAVAHIHQFVSTPGEAVTVVKTMVAKGYVLGKDALIKAKELDESYRVSATAAAKVAELSNRIGLTDKINTSMQTVKSVAHIHQFVSTPGEAVTVVKTMVAKGYVLGKDALIKAKELDESYRVSATAAAKVAELSNRIGLTDKINTSMQTVKSVDEKYHVSDITKSVASVTGTAALTAATFTGRTAVAATTAVVNSSYFAKGALWVSGILSRAAQAAADLGSHGNKQTES